MDLDQAAEDVIAGLGGADNIKSVEGCVTRLRLTLEDRALMDEAALKQAGAHGVSKMGSAIQVVMGTQSDRIASRMNDLLGGKG